MSTRVPKINSALENTPVIDMETGLMTKPWVLWFNQIGIAASPTFGTAIDETPSGVIDGVNPTFTIVQVPNPALSLIIYKNGQRLKRGIAYTVATNIITFLPGYIPSAVGGPDVLSCDYNF